MSGGIGVMLLGQTLELEYHSLISYSLFKHEST